MISILTCVNLLKISIIRKKRGFITVNNKKNINILKPLLKLNLIKFFLIKDKKLFVFLNYNKNKPIFNNILNMYKPSKKSYISYKTLHKTIEKHNWLFVLSTSKGLMSSNDALKMKIGGMIILKIWN